jgi:ethanolamine ammonia-lyase small subunit
MMPLFLHPFSLDRMVRAVEKVRERLLRATAALDAAAVAYAVIGGNAVAAWVARVDEAAVRNTQDVDILLRRADLGAARTALEKAGFIYRHAAGIDMFLDGPTAKARDAVHVLYANEKVRPEYLLPTPDVAESERGKAYQMLTLEALVRMKLTSYRRKDQVHVSDMLEVGLLDSSWLARLPVELADRLQHLIDTPEG